MSNTRDSIESKLNEQTYIAGQDNGYDEAMQEMKEQIPELVQAVKAWVSSNPMWFPAAELQAWARSKFVGDDLRADDLALRFRNALGVAAAEPSAGPSAVSPSGTREDAAAVPNADEPPYGAPEEYNEEVYQRRRHVLLELGAKTQQLEYGNVLFTLGKQALTNRVMMGWFSDDAFAPFLELFEREAREMKEALPASDPTSLFSGATVTLDGELITATGVRYVRVYDPTARYSELFSKAIGVSGPFHVVEIDGPEGRASLYKADGPGLVDEGWHDDPQGAIHRCRAYNNVWREAMDEAYAPFKEHELEHGRVFNQART